MDTETKPTKEELLADIEKLISYGRDEPTINPALLAYLEVDDLISTKKKLLERVGILSEEDKEWLEQFKKYE
jgi:RNA-splicing ligase RtcB